MDSDVEEESIYVKLDPLDSIDIKRNFLEIEASLITAMIVVERFKEARRAKHEVFSRIKKDLKEISEGSARIIEILPKEIKKKILKEKKAEIETIKPKARIEIIPAATERERLNRSAALEKELRDIKSKLNALGSI